MTLIRTDQLQVARGARTLVQGLDWSVQRGELWCVLGPNGVGKTSLMQVLAGVIAPAAGRVMLQETALTSIPSPTLARLRGLMQQSQSDAFSLPVLQTVLIGRTPYRRGRGWESAEEIDAAHRALAEVGLADRAGSDVRELSGGERQRVALATLLMQAPEIFLLDEPTAHQDVAHQLAMLHLLQRLSESSAVVMNCHDINLAARFATHVLLLGAERHWCGPAHMILQPDNLQAAFGCHFRVVEDAGNAHIIAY